MGAFEDAVHKETAAIYYETGVSTYKTLYGNDEQAAKEMGEKYRASYLRSVGLEVTPEL